MRSKLIGKALRKKRVRSQIRGSKERPRLSVFRSNKYIYGQIINDDKGVTLVAASEKEIKQVKSDPFGKARDHPEQSRMDENLKVNSIRQKSKKKPAPTKTERARLVGELLGKKALKLGIKKVVFDRGSYQYHGRVKTLADGARKAGLEF